MIGDLERIGIMAKIAPIIGSGYVLCAEDAGPPRAADRQILPSMSEGNQVGAGPGVGRSDERKQATVRRKRQDEEALATMGGTLLSAVSMNETNTFFSLKTRRASCGLGAIWQRTTYGVMVLERVGYGSTLTYLLLSKR